MMQQGTPRRRRARPVADAPVEVLVGRRDELAKGWLLELVEQVPLARAAAILAGELAQTGPIICEAVLRALGSDRELAALEPGGALESLAASAGVIAAADGVEAALDGLEALTGVIWAAVRRELNDPDPELVAELAERMALVSATLRAGVLRSGSRAPRVSEPGTAAQAAPVSEPGTDAQAAPVSEPVAAAQAAPVSEPGTADPDEVTADPPPGLRLQRLESTVLARPPIPGEADDALWVAVIDDEIRRAKRLGASLSLLLVELEEAERVVAVEAPGEATAMFGRFAGAVRAAVRRHDILACETDTRAWVIARDSGRMAAQALGARIAGAVRSAGSWRGAPLAVGVGLAVLGQDGHDSAGLMEAAEESRFAAVAAGSEVLGSETEE